MSRRALGAALVSALLVAACSSAPAPTGGDEPRARDLSPQDAGSYVVPPPNLSDDGAGSLVSVEPFELSDELNEIDATTYKVVYRSTSGIDGSGTQVSGIVSIPGGVPPKGGWPIISFGHGTTGIQENCGPSAYPNLLGSDEIVQALVLGGYVVTMSDYQGLGLPGSYHPYLDAPTLGNNMIDAVRAAHRLVPDTQRRWGAYGVSLGGMSAWAAADRAGTYGTGLELIATASVVPVADMAGLADAAWDGTLTRDQVPLLIFALQGLDWSFPDFDLEQYRRGGAVASWDTIVQCIPDGDPEQFATDLSGAIDAVKPTDLKPASEAARERLRELLAAKALPAQGITSPMLVMYGTEDPLVNDEWTRAALEKACLQGGSLTIVERVGEGHADLDSSPSFPWLRNVMDGEAPTPTCGGGGA